MIVSMSTYYFRHSILAVSICKSAYRAMRYGLCAVLCIMSMVCYAHAQNPSFRDNTGLSPEELAAMAEKERPVSSPIRVIEVLADVTGKDPNDARERAVDYAQKRAFFLLLSELVPAKASDLVDSIQEDEIFRFVRGYEVLKERSTDNRYQAQFAVSLSESRIRQFAGMKDPNADAPYPVSQDTALIIPVLNNGRETLLWGDNNVWRKIWNSVALERGEGLLVMPYGDPSDVAFVDNTTVLGYRYKDFAALMSRYGTGQVAVVHARYQLESKPAVVKVSARFMANGLDKVRDFSFEALNVDDTPEFLLVQAAARVAEAVKREGRKLQSERKLNDPSLVKVPATVMFSRLSDWVLLQSTLKALPNIASMEVGGLQVNQAEVQLYFEAGTDRAFIKKSLEVQGLAVQDAGEKWRIWRPFVRR